MFVRGEGKRIWGETKLFCVVEAKEEVGDGRSGVVDDFDGLCVLPSELNYLGFDRYDIRSHLLAVKIKTIIHTFLKLIVPSQDHRYLGLDKTDILL